MKHVITISLFFLACLCPPFSADASDEPVTRPNILFLAVDDLRPELGAYGHTEMKTPAIDSLAAAGVTFVSAFTNVPVCGASRASMLSGLRPTATRFLDYTSSVDAEASGVPTMPAWFQQAGYITISLGKVLHDRNDSVESWSEKPWNPHIDSGEGYHGWRDYLLPENQQADMDAERRPPPVEAAEVEDDSYFDGQTAKKAVATLRRLEAENRPFFLAVGFVKPHLPFNAPQRYWDLYPEKGFSLAGQPLFPETAPAQAWHNWGELRAYSGVPPEEGPVPAELALEMNRGYRASISYVDAQVGLILDELAGLGLAENTIVVLWGDHGWSLGEHGLWAKHSAFQLANRIPLIMRVPGGDSGIAHGLVETVGIYPTLVELAGLPLPDHLQGRSFAAAARNPAAATFEAVFPRWQDGDSIRTDRYYYTEWRDQAGEVVSRMLYDHLNDPDERHNVAENPDYSFVVSQLSAALREHIASF